MADLLHRSAARYPDKTAIVDGTLRLTYATFERAVEGFASALSARGMSRGDRVALLSHNCWQYAVITFATAKLGMVLVPINFMLTAGEVAYILAHSGSTAMLSEDALIGTAQAAIDQSGVQMRVRGSISPTGGEAPDGWEDVDVWTDPSDHEFPEVPEVMVEDDEPLRLMYTSGTESRPKGVLLTSKSLIAQYVSCIVDGGMSSDDVEIHSLPMYHCAQMDCFFVPDVYLGATSIILPGPDPAALLRTIETERVTKLFCPPTVWISLLRHPDFDNHDLSSLRKAYYGASPMPVEVLKELGQRLPNTDFWNFYGQTEMSPVATILAPREQVSRAGSAGRPALNVETRVVDDAGAPVPAGEVGEIVHRSPQATVGYYNDDEKTAAAFEGGWFHSGDLGFVDADGYLTVVDRKKDMIKSGGENVASREVEEALYTIEGVGEVAVFGVSHPLWIEAVTAVIVPKQGVELTREQVDEHAQRLLAPYKRPKFVVFADALPKNPSGKILKRDLRTTYGDIGASS